MFDEDDEYGINPDTGLRVRRGLFDRNHGFDFTTGEYVRIMSPGDSGLGWLIAAAFHAFAVIVTDAALLLALTTLWLWHLARAAASPRHRLRDCFAYLSDAGRYAAKRMGLPLLVGCVVMAATGALFAIPHIRDSWYGFFLLMGGTLALVSAVGYAIYQGHGILRDLWVRARPRTR